MANQYVERAVIFFAEALQSVPSSETVIAALKATTLGLAALSDPMSHEFDPLILAIDCNIKL